MNKNFCHAQINRGHHLFFEHNKTVGEVADIMKITIPAAWHLLRLVKQKFDTKYKLSYPGTNTHVSFIWHLHVSHYNTFPSPLQADANDIAMKPSRNEWRLENNFAAACAAC